MRYTDYQYIAKELAKRHPDIINVLNTAEDDIISPESAKILLRDYFIAIGELQLKDDGKMFYEFNINKFRVVPIENSKLSEAPLPKTIDGLKLSSLLNEERDNPLHWYDRHKNGDTWYAIAKDTSKQLDGKDIKRQVLKIEDAIQQLRYRELAS